MRLQVRVGGEVSVSRSIVVRTSGDERENHASIEGAYGRALRDATWLGIDIPAWGEFLMTLEEGRTFEMTGPAGSVTYRIEPLLG